MARTKGLYPTAKATITAQLAKPVERGAQAYADKLRENVSAGSRSGVQYSSLPRQSSSPSEFPQEQSGDLRASVDARPTSNPLHYQAGFFDENALKLRSLEFGSIHMSERSPLQRTADDPETKREMLEAAMRRQ